MSFKHLTEEQVQRFANEVRNAIRDLSARVRDAQDGVAHVETSISQGQITSKVWQEGIDAAKDKLNNDVDVLSDQYSSLTQNVDGIESTVVAVKSTADSASVTASYAAQKVDSITLRVIGSDGQVSEIQLNDQGQINLLGTVLAQKIMAEDITATGEFRVNNGVYYLTQTENGFSMGPVTEDILWMSYIQVEKTGINLWTRHNENIGAYGDVTIQSDAGNVYLIGAGAGISIGIAVQVDANLLPSDANKDIGSSSSRWRNLYVTGINLNGTDLGTTINSLSALSTSSVTLASGWGATHNWCRKRGNAVEVFLFLNQLQWASSSGYVTFGTLPSGYRPPNVFIVTAQQYNSGTNQTYAVQLRVGTDGALGFQINGDRPATSVNAHFTFLL